MRSCVIVNVAISSTKELLKQTWLLLLRRDSQTEGSLDNLDDFDQDVIIGNVASEERENAIVNEGSSDQDFTVGTSSDKLVTNEKTLNVKNLERCFYERINREISELVDTVEDRVQNAILTAIDNTVALRVELAIRSINACSGRDATSLAANSEHGEHLGVKASFENPSGNNDLLHVSNVKDETRNNIPVEVSELPVPETRFDRQHTHSSHGDRSNNPNRSNP